MKSNYFRLNQYFFQNKNNNKTMCQVMLEHVKNSKKIHEFEHFLCSGHPLKSSYWSFRAFFCKNQKGKQGKFYFDILKILHGKLFFFWKYFFISLYIFVELLFFNLCYSQFNDFSKNLIFHSCFNFELLFQYNWYLTCPIFCVI